ncbi:MAG: M48 family metalloprotease [Nitrospiraceae bacterium]
MMTSTRSITQMVLILMGFYSAFGVSAPSFGEFEDQHDVKFIVSALRSPIPPDMVAQARSMDDQIMSSGTVQDQKVYLVTDNRLQRVNSLVRRLLMAMGQDDREWVVRILDTQPPTINAFVYGGKYIYVYTGLLNEAASEDELAVVLGHELGHSLLKHFLRSQQDTTNNLTGLAEVIGAIAGGKKGYEKVSGVTKAMRASYSRTDEEEADSIGVTIAWKAGFNPLRGADFFTRMSRRASDEAAKTNQQFAQKRSETEQALALCQQWIAAAKANPFKRNKAQAVCDDAEQRRQHFNQMVAQFNSEQRTQQIYGDHPSDQNRIAAIAALSDYINGRRDIESLQRFQQSYRVMAALKQIDSPLLKSAEAKLVDQERKVDSESAQTEKGKDKHQLPGDPPWLDRQRVLNESRAGQQLKQDLKEFFTERKKPITAWEEKLRAMEKMVKENPNDQQARSNFKEEISKYKSFVESANSELNDRKKSATDEFNSIVTRTLSKMNKQQMLGNDPNASLIAILNKSEESSTNVSKPDSEQSHKADLPIADQLKQLKMALEQGLITDKEYQSKRKQILERF